MFSSIETSNDMEILLNALVGACKSTENFESIDQNKMKILKDLIIEMLSKMKVTESVFSHVLNYICNVIPDDDSDESLQFNSFITEIIKNNRGKK